MTDDIWSELLRSPLDPEPKDPEDEGRSVVWATLGAAAVGTVLGGLWLLAAPRPSEVAIQPTTTTSSLPAPIPSDATSLPPGYVAVAYDGEPVGAAFGLRPESTYTLGDDLYVTMSSVVRAELDPEAVPVFPGGDWTLEAGSEVASFTGEITNPLSPGLLTVRFAGAGESLAGASVLSLRPIVESKAADVREAFVFNGLPAAIEDPLEIELDDGVRFVLDRLELGADAGTLTWHLEALPSVRARVDAIVEYSETIDQEGGETVLVVEHWVDPYPFQRPPKPTPNPSWSGREVLRRVGADLADPAAITRAQLLLEVKWQRASPDRIIEIPLESGDG